MLTLIIGCRFLLSQKTLSKLPRKTFPLIQNHQIQISTLLTKSSKQTENPLPQTNYKTKPEIIRMRIAAGNQRMAYCFGKTDCSFLMMTLNYEHDYWTKCIAKFLLLTQDKQRHSNWSRAATIGLHGEKMLNDTCGTATNANARRIPEIRRLGY